MVCFSHWIFHGCSILKIIDSRHRSFVFLLTTLPIFSTDRVAFLPQILGLLLKHLHEKQIQAVYEKTRVDEAKVGRYVERRYVQGTTLCTAANQRMTGSTIALSSTGRGRRRQADVQSSTTAPPRYTSLRHLCHVHNIEERTYTNGRRHKEFTSLFKQRTISSFS